MKVSNVTVMRRQENPWRALCIWKLLIACHIRTASCSHAFHVVCILQVKVQESGGPEEIFNVVCKWAATVDIRSLNQYIQ